MTDYGYLRDRASILVSGVTGARTKYGGKTAWASWYCDTYGRECNDVVIFLNSKGDTGPERFADVVVSSVDRAGAAFRDPNVTWVTITPDTHDWAKVSERLQTAVRSMPSNLSKCVVLDEAPELSSEALQWFVRVSGNGNNCKPILISQAPGDLTNKVRKQCILLWVGPTTENNRHVFRANHRENHFDAIANHDPYQWSVMLGPDESDRDTFQPVPGEYADD